MSAAPTSDLPPLFDFIIVGAGSAGCTAAARIVHLHPTAQVALIESGGDFFGGTGTTYRNISDPSRWPRLSYGPADRSYLTVPQQKLNGRRLPCARGIGLGGTSLINVMLWSRGFRDDWDERMPGGWSGKDVEEEFRWIEERIRPAKMGGEEYDGGLALSLREAALMLGLGAEEEKAAAESGEGLWERDGASGSYRATIDSNGQRTDIFRAIGAHHDRVHVVRGNVEKVLMCTSEPKTAEGVILRKPDGEKMVIGVNKRGEVILSCGVIDTPKLLQLSGIGRPTLLGRLGISVVHPLNGVGENLKEHPMVPMGFQGKKKMSANSQCPNTVVGWVNDKPNGIQIVCVNGRSNSSLIPMVLHDLLFSFQLQNGTILRRFLNLLILLTARAVRKTAQLLIDWAPSLKTKLEQDMGFLVAVMNPKSTGTVMIQSADPTVPPAIDLNFLSRDEEVRALLSGIDQVRKIAKSSPMAETVGAETMPGKLFKDDLEFVRGNVVGYGHPSGTCAIGTCLNEDLTVIGIKGLRVADASSLPWHPRCQIAAPCMLIGARCATLVAKK